MFAKSSFGGRIDAFKFRRPVAHFHDGHTGTAPVEQFLADALQHRKRQSRRPRIKIEGALDAPFRNRSRTHVSDSSRTRSLERTRPTPGPLAHSQNSRDD